VGADQTRRRNSPEAWTVPRVSALGCAGGEKIPEPEERREIACVGLISKLKTEGATPRAMHPSGNEALVAGPGLFLLRGVRVSLLLSRYVQRLVGVLGTLPRLINQPAAGAP
jgi:hypothetical protein